MIREVKAAPLAFQTIVVEAISDALAEHGFRLDAAAAQPQDQDWVMDFTREREGQQEFIRVGRRFYDREKMSANDIDDEVGSPRDDAQGRFWASRHYMSVQIITNYTHADLLRTGKIGWSNTDEDWWYFKDKEELRQKLHDEVLPLILTVGLQKLDDRLEDIHSPQGQQWRAFQEREQEEMSKAVAELGDTYTEEQYKAALLGAMRKVNAEASAKVTEPE